MKKLCIKKQYDYEPIKISVIKAGTAKREARGPIYLGGPNIRACI